MPKKSFFDKEASLALKGIAIMMMMLHHNFRAHSLFDKYIISFYPFNEQQVINLAASCKICVSLFAFISGYGLFLSCRKSKTNPSKWFAKRYILTFSGFWFVWIVSAIITQLVDGRLVKILCKEDIYKSILYIITDFLGLAKLFHT
ncbi:MAG: acyltransferase family protein, partial [Lachnospiraceae bacterium]|nr:acyltransferase family protein [Lachnospiraceae bacterium]